jgi:hypothetical protein
LTAVAAARRTSALFTCYFMPTTAAATEAVDSNAAAARATFTGVG